MSRKGFMSPLERAQAELDALLGTQEGQPPEGGEQKPAEEPSDPTPPPAEEPPQPPAEPEPTPAPVENQDDYKHKYQTLQGMFRKTQEQVSQLLDQNRALMERLEKASQPQTADTGNAGAEGLQVHLEKLAHEYGTDFTDALRGFIGAELGMALKEQLAPVQEQIKSVAADTTKTRQEKFQEALTQRVSDWRTLYETDEFHGWLQGVREPLSGDTYADLFERANQRYNLDGMAAIFEKYKEATGKLTQTPNNPPPTPPPADPRQSLVTPGRTGGATPAPTAAPTAKTWTEAEITAFYRDLRNNIYLGREAEAAKIEADIFRANQEGRIVG